LSKVSVTRFTRITIPRCIVNQLALHLRYFLPSLFSYGEVAGAGRLTESTEYTFRAIRLFSSLTCQVFRSILDTAVRVEPRP
jgi:hypothetical protein